MPVMDPKQKSKEALGALAVARAAWMVAQSIVVRRLEELNCPNAMEETHEISRILYVCERLLKGQTGEGPTDAR